jgi:hypothetical protein
MGKHMKQADDGLCGERARNLDVTILTCYIVRA